MKAINSLMLFLILLVFASFTNDEARINLEKLHAPMRRSILLSIQAYKMDRTVEVRFLQKVGNVNVQIVTSCGDIIWNQIYDTSNTTSTFIELSPIEIGEDASYVITITASEEVLEGEFHL